MRTREPWVHFSFSPSPIYLYRAIWFARSPRVAWLVAHMVAQCDRARARARRLVVCVACGGCDVVVRSTPGLRRWEPYGNRCDVFINTHIY